MEKNKIRRIFRLAQGRTAVSALGQVENDHRKRGYGVGQTTWDVKMEERRFFALWGKKKTSGCRYSAIDWNKKADNWKHEIQNAGEHKRSYAERVAATVAYLRSQKLLQPEHTVLDVGCGLGRFCVEFAKTAQHVTGVDLSPQMLHHAQAHATEQGIENVSFYNLDFKTADLEIQGWAKKFDLVFASLTPALSEPTDIEKLEQASRAYCFSSSFVQTYDATAQAAMAYACPEGGYNVRRNGRSFYALFNLLWLRGRYPRVEYHTEARQERMQVGPALVQHILDRYFLPAHPEHVANRVLEYLQRHADQDGMIDYPSQCMYGWLLWDVRMADARIY